MRSGKWRTRKPRRDRGGICTLDLQVDGFEPSHSGKARGSEVSSLPGLTGNRPQTRHPSAEESLDLAVSQAYQELRAIAHHRLAGQLGGTLSTTALVNETYLKLAG